MLASLKKKKKVYSQILCEGVNQYLNYLHQSAS